MNPLELFSDHQVSDILINSTRPIQVEKNGKLSNVEMNFETEEEIKVFAKCIISEAGSRLDIAKPYAEAKLENEYGLLRVHALLGNECSVGTQVSIRRHPKTSFTLESLTRTNFLDDEQLKLIREIVLTKKNFVICGSTGSGKTTLLRAMLAEVVEERIITIEDSPELHLNNSVSLFTRLNNQEGVGEISLQELIRQSLRMRPDRLVIGEARGAELALLLQALNTGHKGAGFTIHANHRGEVVSRMLGMLLQAGVSTELGRLLIGSAIDYVIEVGVLSQRAVISIEKLVV